MVIKWTMEEVQASLNTFPITLFTDIKKQVVILGILRGGKAPADILAHRTGMDLEYIRITDGVGNLKSCIGDHSYVIFIDDINDSGATIFHFVELMMEAYPNADEPLFQFWTLIKRLGTSMPEINAGVTIDREDWVEFPWDQDESHERTNDPSEL